MKDIQLVKCECCGSYIPAPYLVVDGRIFCGWEHYRMWRDSHMESEQLIQQEFVYDIEV